uniref:Uncharacterized protein n=1 Tax=Triticum urartu TaxID=4572 RepID=A0A8R7PJV4_TRIUA
MLFQVPSFITYNLLKSCFLFSFLFCQMGVWRIWKVRYSCHAFAIILIYPTIFICPLAYYIGWATENRRTSGNLASLKYFKGT